MKLIAIILKIWFAAAKNSPLLLTKISGLIDVVKILFILRSIRSHRYTCNKYRKCSLSRHLNVLRHILYNILSYFFKRSHTTENLWANSFHCVQSELLMTSLYEMKYKYFNVSQAEDGQDNKRYIASSTTILQLRLFIDFSKHKMWYSGE